MSAGEAVRMIVRHGADRLARVLLVAPTTPRLLAGPDNPDGLPQAVFDEMVAGLASDKPGFLAGFAPSFFGGADAVSAELMS
jgi:non-heme chloroperoxidase